MKDNDDWTPVDDQTFLSTIGEVVQRSRDGLMEVGLRTDPRHKNRSNIVHGGVYMTLIDRALGLSCRSLGGGRRMATASLTVNFVRPAKIGDFLHITCTISKNGRKAAFGEAVLKVDGVVCCTATGVFMTVDGPAPARDVTS
ncbi:PaaI family thioesterase [Paracoccus sp. (in: a-proteobacteria)]|uniref:PaaI family thioesterase n=1 Tax=Paracoccus sp. TaxID=267 RepID=UPI002B000BD2|nr:PaaI family thioesterase [Paracoccus sp. (in: a-proteobacteria)]